MTMLCCLDTNMERLMTVINANVDDAMIITFYFKIAILPIPNVHACKH